MVTVAVIALHFVAAHLWPSVRNMTSLLLLVVAYATYAKGIRSGAISGLLVFVYLVYDLSVRPFHHYTVSEVERIGSFALVVPGIIGLVHGLRLRVVQSELERVLALQEISLRIAHDLRGPLIQVLRYAELLEVEHRNELHPPMDRFVSRIRSNGQVMDRLVDELVRSTSASSRQPHPNRSLRGAFHRRSDETHPV